MAVKFPASRILSVDAFRGITIFLMIFVNELAGVSGIPDWMKHAGADDDAMTFVDVVFPAFLFIVGMSIPFSMQAHKLKGDSWLKISGHVVLRSLGLMVIGVFMVNAEGDFDEQAMGMSIHAWTLLFYGGVFLTWFDYRSPGKTLMYIGRGAGIVLLLVLAALYRDEGGDYIGTRWWGILGLIGWAYLIGSCLYVLSGGYRFMLLVLTLACMTYYVLGHFAFRENVFHRHPFFSQAGHAIHTSIVIAGMILSLIFYKEELLTGTWQRYKRAMMFMLVMLAAGLFMRPMLGVSKIYATPSWAAFSIVICIVTFGLLYLLIDHWKVTRWTALFNPAANNPLLVYVLPYIIYASMQIAGISFPSVLYQGAVGIVWTLCYAALVMIIGWMLVRVNMRLKL